MSREGGSTAGRGWEQSSAHRSLLCPCTPSPLQHCDENLLALRKMHVFLLTFCFATVLFLIL